MSIVVKKDLKKLLPPFASAIMAGLGLAVITVFAAMMENGDFAITALVLFFIAMLVVNIYTMYKNATLFRDNLLDEAYLKALVDKGLDYKTFAVNKMLVAIIQCIVLVTEYLLLFIVSFLIANSKISLFGEEIAKKDMSFFAVLFDNQSTMYSSLFGGSGAALFLVYLEWLFLVIAATVVCFAAYGLCHTYFIRGRYRGVAGFMTFSTIFWLVWKLYDLFVPTDGALRTPLAILYCVAVSAGLGFVVVKVVTKKTFKVLQLM